MASFGHALARAFAHSVTPYQTRPVRFSIVTPSFRSGPWLRLCIASVADQQQEHEHIVQDAVSDDGTLDWLRSDTRVQAHVEKDQGMYDAINRGLRRSSGEILAWLNADEQYLPGALNLVADFFHAHPETDVVFGDVVMVDPAGSYLWHRKMQIPLKYHTWTAHLSTLSCAMFFRRRVVFDNDCFFDPRLRDVGDGEWMVRLLQRNTRMHALGHFTSAFTQTGQNMSQAPNARREAQQLRDSAPGWARMLRPWWILHHRIRRWARGMYRQEPFAYEVYTRQSPNRRERFAVSHPRFQQS